MVVTNVIPNAFTISGGLIASSLILIIASYPLNKKNDITTDNIAELIDTFGPFITLFMSNDGTA